MWQPGPGPNLATGTQHLQHDTKHHTAPHPHLHPHHTHTTHARHHTTVTHTNTPRERSSRAKRVSEAIHDNPTAIAQLYHSLPQLAHFSPTCPHSFLKHSAHPHVLAKLFQRDLPNDRSLDLTICEPSLVLMPNVSINNVNNSWNRAMLGTS